MRLDRIADVRAVLEKGGDADFDLAPTVGRQFRQLDRSPDPARRSAHLGPDLRTWVASAAQLLRPQGTLTLIYRADGLADVLNALAGDFGSIGVIPVFPKQNAAAIRIVVRALKGSRGALTLCPGLLLNEGGRPTPAAEAILRDGAALNFDD